MQHYFARLFEIVGRVLSSVYEGLVAVHGASELVLELDHSLQFLLAMKIDVDLLKGIQRLLFRLEALVPLDQSRRQMDL